MNAHDGRSRAESPPARRRGGLLDRQRLAGQDRLVALELVGLEQPHVGRHDVADAERDDVAGHELRRGDRDLGRRRARRPPRGGCRRAAPRRRSPARYSLTNPRPTLSSTITAMMTASVGSPVRPETARRRQQEDQERVAELAEQDPRGRHPGAHAGRSADGEQPLRGLGPAEPGSLPDRAKTASGGSVPAVAAPASPVDESPAEAGPDGPPARRRRRRGVRITGSSGVRRDRSPPGGRRASRQGHHVSFTGASSWCPSALSRQCMRRVRVRGNVDTCLPPWASTRDPCALDGFRSSVQARSSRGKGRKACPATRTRPLNFSTNHLRQAGGEHPRRAAAPRARRSAAP